MSIRRFTRLSGDAGPRGLLAAACVALLMCGCQTPSHNVPPPARWEQTRLEATLQAADEWIVAGHLERARQTLSSLGAYQDPRLTLTMAQLDVEEGDYAAALERLDSTAAAPPGTPAWPRLRGVALEGLGQWAEAARAYAQAYQLQRAAELLIAQVENLVLAGQRSEARALLDRERGHCPGEPALQVLAARLEARCADPEAAVAELEIARLAQPESDEIRRRLAEAYAAARRYGDASGIWRELAAAAADDAERRRYRTRLACCLLSAHKYDEARHVYRILVVMDPADDAAWLGRAAASLAADQPAEALEAALHLLHKDGSQVDARMIAALSYRRLGLPDDAVAILSNAPNGAESAESVEALLARWR